MDAATRARVLALAGIEVRATQSSGGGQTTGGKTAHEPAGSPKGGQFTSSPGSGIGYQSILPSASAYNSGGGSRKPAAAAPANTPQAPTTPRTMKPGDSGEDVRYAQYAMSLLGFKVSQDGQYGPETEAAVKQIQERLGVTKPNGHLSSAQLRKLQDAVRLSPCVGQGQRDLSLEAQWEARDVEEFDDVLDEDTEALIAALGEFIGSDERSFNEALHPRNPKGSVGGGRFRSITDRIVAALSEWKHGNGPDDPLKDFNRDQLLKAAKAHGHTFRRGASIEEIKAQILDDVRNGTKAEKAATPHLPGAPADHRRFTIQLGGPAKEAPRTMAEELAQRPRADLEKLARMFHVGTSATDPRALAYDIRASRLRAWHVPGEDSEADQAKAAAGADEELRRGLREIDANKPAKKAAAKAESVDVGIFGNPTTGKLSLYRESDTGKKQGRAIKSFDDMAALESWARDNGHTELADYAKAEHARTSPKAAPTKIPLSDQSEAEILNATKSGQLSRPDAVAELRRRADGAARSANGLRLGNASGEVSPMAAALIREQDAKAAQLRKLADDIEAEHARTGEAPAATKSSAHPAVEGIAAQLKAGKITPDEAAKLLSEHAATQTPMLRQSGGDKKFAPSHVPAGQGAFGGDKPAAKMAKAAPAATSSDPLAGLEGLTAVQKRAALRKRGLSKAEIDALAPLEKRPRTAKRSLDPEDDTDPNLAEIEAWAEENPDDLDDDPKAGRARELALLGVTRALGHDVTPGHDELHHYWTIGAGRHRWVDSPKPWTTLLANLVEEVHDKPLETLKRWASRWFFEVKGYYAGSDLNRVAHGHPPRGHRIGPG